MNVPLYSILCVYKGLLSWASGGAATFSFMIGPGFYIILIMFVLSIYNYSVTRRRYPKIFVITTKRDKTSLYTQKPPKNFLNYMRSYYDIIPELHQKKIGWCPNTTMIYSGGTDFRKCGNRSQSLPGMPEEGSLYSFFILSHPKNRRSAARVYGDRRPSPVPA